MTPVTAVTARVPAKINLQLAVGPVRADGYHDVITVYHAVSLFDEVTVAPAKGDSVVVTGEGAGSVPADASNLAPRAAAALLRAVGPGVRGSPGLAFRISKRIPVAAGLAGGSADAAAALVACNELWRAGLSHAELSGLASGIGSDVAFALLGGTAIGIGRGEQVTPALAAGTYHWVLAFADGGLSTGEVYAACDRIRAARGREPETGETPRRTDDAGRGAGGAGQPAEGTARRADGAGRGARGARGTGQRAQEPARRAGGSAAQRRAPRGAAGRPVGPAVLRSALDGGAGQAVGTGGLAVDTRIMTALRSGNPAELGPLLSNDLQLAAISLRPELRRTLAAGAEHGALGAIVCGSGPTCAYLAKDARHARDLAVALAGAGVCRTVAHVTGPVPGASLIPVAAGSA